MRHLFFFLITALSISHVSAQKSYGINPSPQIEKFSSYSYAPQENDITLSWLETDNQATAFGLNREGTMAVFMELYPEDMINVNNTGKKPVSIKQIQFHINSANFNLVTDSKICIRQGTSFNSSTEVYSQTVTNLTQGWNNIDLTTDYTIDHGQNLYIGYQLTQSAAGYPYSLATGDNPKQAWLMEGDNRDNLTLNYDLVFLIKAIALAEDSPENEITLQSVDLLPFALQGEETEIGGTVKNLGLAPVNSFTVAYSIDGESSEPYTFTGLDIAPNATYSFKYPDKYTLDETKIYTVSVTISDPNGVEDETSNNSRTADLPVYSESVPRIVLHESFTSSTCGPCYAGNQNLKAVLDAADPDKWANIRYQMSWPSTGDPYYTAEGGVRSNYYRVNSVPQLVVDGGSQFNDHPGNYSNAQLNKFAAIPAAAYLSGTAETVSKTVNATITITPVLNADKQNLHLFAAIVEKKTTKNRKTNGETEFHFVMKKFLTAAEGNPVENFEVGVPQSFPFSYTFNGNYRLPSNASATNIIKHDREHSVENFENLMIVYWIQHVQTKEVYQAGKADATFQIIDGLNNILHDGMSVSVREGSLFIHSETPARQVAIYNISGQKILSTPVFNNKIDISNLESGVYIAKIEMKDGVEKVIKINK
jgi:hypothetical protein